MTQCRPQPPTGIPGPVPSFVPLRSGGRPLTALGCLCFGSAQSLGAGWAEGGGPTLPFPSGLNFYGREGGSTSSSSPGPPRSTARHWHLAYGFIDRFEGKSRFLRGENPEVTFSRGRCQDLKHPRDECEAVPGNESRVAGRHWVRPGDGAPRGAMGGTELQVTSGSALGGRQVTGGPACRRGALWDVPRALSVRDRRKLPGVRGQERMGGTEALSGGAAGAPGDPHPARSPRLTQIRVLQNAVRYVGRVAVQVPAFLAKKDLAELTTAAARGRPLGLQHARLLREVPSPADGHSDAQGPARPPALQVPGRALAHLSAGAAGPRSKAKGSSQPQKPLSARRSSATCWALGSWRSGL